MGYGGGSFDFGGGGFDGGGWDGGSSDLGGDDGDADCDECSKENRPKFILGFVSFFLFLFALALILVGSLAPWARNVCGSITDLNRGEQRICQITKN